MENKEVTKTIFFTLFLLILVLSTIKISVFAGDLDDFNVISENKNLNLYINEETAEIAVEKKETGSLWFSNPQNVDQMENIRGGTSRDRLKSQFVINYYTPNDTRQKMDSFNDSVQNERFNIEKIDKGVKVNYVLGKEWTEDSYLPRMVTKKKFEEEILAQIEEKDDRELFMNNYPLITLEKRKEKPYQDREVDRPGYTIDLEELFGYYELEIKDTPQKILDTDDSIGDILIRDGRGYFELLVECIEQLEEPTDIRPEHIQNLKENEVYVLLPNAVAKWDKEDMVQILKDIGYTPRDVQDDHLENNIDPPLPNREIFEIPLEYRLEGDSLTTSIKGEDIYYPEEESYSLYSIDLLKNFEAANRDEKGYMFVPDGSGALIDFNNNKTEASRFKKSVYGGDDSQPPPVQKYTDQETIKMPVFGMNKGEQGFLTIIEDGETSADIVADISGKDSSYNRSYTEFLIRGREQVRVGESSQPKNAQFIPENDYKLKHIFLEEENTDYVSMAEEYRNYLIDKYNLTRMDKKEDIPFYVDFVGGIKATKSIWGFPQQVTHPLTSFDQIPLILEELEQQGIKKVKVNFQGWMEEGVSNSFVRNLEPAAMLGGEEKFQELIEYFKENESELYPEVDFLKVDGNNTSSVNERKELAYQLDQNLAETYMYEENTFLRSSNHFWYLYSPKHLPDLLQEFQDNDKYQRERISLASLGNKVFSDFNKNNYIDQEKSLKIIRKQLDDIAGDYNILARGANEYMLPYTRDILKLPDTDSNHKIVDRGIPFNQIVLHGFFNYAGYPLNDLNRYTDKEDKILRALEIGQLPYYKWIYEKSMQIKDTDYEYLLSVDYRDWLEEAGEIYNEVAPILNRVQGHLIEDHKQIAEKVYLTEYEKGPVIIVNYNNNRVRVKDIEIEAKSYYIMEEGETSAFLK
ncbi:MAG: DUF5696 domain-containing protein [bacterium]